MQNLQLIHPKISFLLSFDFPNFGYNNFQLIVKELYRKHNFLLWQYDLKYKV